MLTSTGLVPHAGWVQPYHHHDASALFACSAHKVCSGERRRGDETHKGGRLNNMEDMIKGSLFVLEAFIHPHTTPRRLVLLSSWSRLCLR